VLADLEPKKGAGLDIVAAATDRHLYAWHADGESVKGFPVLIGDPEKVASVDPVSNEPKFTAGVPSDEDKSEDQGKLVDTPAVANLEGPDKPPTIIVGSNEEYLTGKGSEGSIDAGDLTTSSLGVIGESGLLSFANGRVYAVKSTGCAANRPRARPAASSASMKAASRSPSAKVGR
jgi:hypothetical protein